MNKRQKKKRAGKLPVGERFRLWLKRSALTPLSVEHSLYRDSYIVEIAGIELRRLHP